MTLKKDYSIALNEMNYYKKRCEKLMIEIIRLNKIISKTKNTIKESIEDNQHKLKCGMPEREVVIKEIKKIQGEINKGEKA